MPKVNSLVLDAGPLITQSASTLQQHADKFFTTPGVFNELRDEHARRQAALWGEKLSVRQPKFDAIKAMTDFAKLTGDHMVLSQNDIHILALAYELECELNNGPWRLRSYPGEKKERQKKRNQNSKERDDTKDIDTVQKEKSAETSLEHTEVSDTNERTKRKTRRGGKRHRKKRTNGGEEGVADLKEQVEIDGNEDAAVQQITEKLKDLSTDCQLSQAYSDSEDEGEWITPDNIVEEMFKDEHEQVEAEKSTSKIKVALATGDFAVQNVSLQIGLNLMNPMSGLQIQRVRNYMLRCHACFTMIPIPKDGTPKHFCSSCGGATLLRCAVSVNSKGEIVPHLKKNFEWHRKGDRYSLPSPLSKNYTKKYGKQGYQHRGNPNLENIFLREDQKEYQQALKNAKWQLRQNEKAMQEYVGGGSAENFVSPFFTGTDHIKPVHVRVGRGRYVNSSRRRK
ncbi:hypothetical protein KL911_002967 [Ogataea haglerorum]|uniref:uncharacterized protein n=1 Tax=Ogataea haglerorum TaxID=1937702 RepID=UPI001C891537|nr:uncharacterized protein KL911_002967 [Ogataea haglerorum]KAG7692702.1 hypothetical protein KL951_004949 [Ogataea haglerorum]KAG7747846.1 hypothetical protein KL912_003218 [Ogataea haglerorum]KAG7753574.1 hypothetical protein KL911_002967 [Ogataea haglerorum]KAG7801731.1 hypothetical protein KL944_002799 [Ogataea haglerorum]